MKFIRVLLTFICVLHVEALYRVEVGTDDNSPSSCGVGPIRGVQVKKDGCTVVNTIGACVPAPVPSMPSIRTFCLEQLESLPFAYVRAYVYHSRDVHCNSTTLHAVEVIPINSCYNRAKVTCTVDDVELYTYNNNACTGVATHVMPLARDLCITSTGYPTKYECFT